MYKLFQSFSVFIPTCITRVALVLNQEQRKWCSWSKYGNDRIKGDRYIK